MIRLNGNAFPAVLSTARFGTESRAPYRPVSLGTARSMQGTATGIGSKFPAPECSSSCWRWWASSKFGPGNRVRKPREGCNRIADCPAKCSNLVRPRDLDALQMVHNQTTNFRKLAAQFVLGRIAPASVTLASAWHRPHLDRLRLFDCVRAVRPDWQLYCISTSCRYFCCRVGQGE
jgi:hypothetical protein